MKSTTHTRSMLRLTWLVRESGQGHSLHMPLLQAPSEPPQLLPQVPQLLGSVVRAVHEPSGHLVVPLTQDCVQAPAEHVESVFGSLLWQTLPQLPQLAVSELVSTQTPLQGVKPVLQVVVQVPAEQLATALGSVVEQAVPQEPQF